MRVPRSSSARLARLPSGDDRQLDLTHALESAVLRRVNEEAERADRRAAEDLWDQGRLLLELVELRSDGDVDAVCAQFVEGAEAAHERMHIARATSRILAGVYGAARLQLGLRLLELLGLKRLDQLETVDLPVADADGRPVRFPATREQLAVAVALLEG
ncbi:MAG: hypothetical protein RL199_1862 [Pseudomonadota bacterium]|jgi:hypothetical protein